MELAIQFYHNDIALYIENNLLHNPKDQYKYKKIRFAMHLSILIMNFGLLI